MWTEETLYPLTPPYLESNQVKWCFRVYWVGALEFWCRAPHARNPKQKLSGGHATLQQIFGRRTPKKKRSHCSMLKVGDAGLTGWRRRLYSYEFWPRRSYSEGFSVWLRFKWIVRCKCHVRRVLQGHASTTEHPIPATQCQCLLARKAHDFFDQIQPAQSYTIIVIEVAPAWTPFLLSVP